jgi:hypothetical protein
MTRLVPLAGHGAREASPEWSSGLFTKIFDKTMSSHSRRFERS